jgi:TPR repeat protein
MYHLSICYHDGLGVEKNREMAVRYLFAAADRGFKKAIDVINENKIERPISN